MAKKVNVCVFDKDHRVEEKIYELSEAGDKISIVKEGAGYFMPEIDNYSFLEFKSWKKFILFGERTYIRKYFVNNRAKKCYNFKTGEISLPDIEGLKKAIANDQLSKLGAEKQQVPAQLWAAAIFSFLGFLLILTTSGVLR